MEDHIKGPNVKQGISENNLILYSRRKREERLEKLGLRENKGIFGRTRRMMINC